MMTNSTLSVNLPGALSQEEVEAAELCLGETVERRTQRGRSIRGLRRRMVKNKDRGVGVASELHDRRGEVVARATRSLAPRRRRSR